MTTSTAERGLGGGEHVCLVHDSDSERAHVLEHHVASAFQNGERLLVLAESTTDQQLTDLFGRTGHGARDGQVDVRDARDAYLGDGSFEPDTMISVLESAKRSALADGFTGLRILAEMDWASSGAPGSDRLPEYEHVVNRVFADGRATAVCQYDRRRFAAGDIAACAAAHGSLASAFDPDEVIEDDHVSIHVGRHGTVHVNGEVDMGNVELLERALATAAERAGDVCVDASELTFVDVRALHALMSAGRSGNVAVLAPPSPLRVMIDALDLRRREPGLTFG